MLARKLIPSATAFVKNPTLSDFQIDLFSIIFWVYPFVLVLIARLLYKLHQHKPKLAVKLLLLSAVIFYIVLVSVGYIGFSV